MDSGQQQMWIDLKSRVVKTIRMKSVKVLGLALLLLAQSAQAQFTFATNNAALILTQYSGTDSVVIIPGMTNGWPVRAIGAGAFEDCTNLANVSIPNTVMDIGNSAFIGCSRLETLTIPPSVTNIDFQAFTECGLTNVIIPGSVRSIGTSAFLYCFALANVTLSNGVALLGYDMFYGCSNLATISIPASCTNIQDEAFAECYGLTNIAVDVGSAVFSSVGGVMFNKAQKELVLYPPGLVGSYTAPNTVASIGSSAFKLCKNLTGISMPNGVTNIGASAFTGCTGLTNLVLPPNLVAIGTSAFSGCGGLATITIPNSVTTIGSGAFSGTSLTTISIPASVTNIVAASFVDCARLVTIKVDTNSPAYRSVGGVLFDLNQTTLVEFPMGQAGSFSKPGSYVVPAGTTSVGDGAFTDCYFITNVTLPSGLARIGNFAFDECARLVNLNIPDSVTNIGNFAFSGTSLTNVTISAQVTTLGALGYWASLRSLYFEGNAPSRGDDDYVIFLLQNAKAYYLPGTTGWDTFSQTAELSTAFWLPQLSSNDGRFGVQTNQFGFSINWASGQTVVVETCTNLFAPNWQPVQTNALTGDPVYFSAPLWTNSSARFYRLRSP
jgi:hypothetical protein